MMVLLNVWDFNQNFNNKIFKFLKNALKCTWNCGRFSDRLNFMSFWNLKLDKNVRFSWVFRKNINIGTELINVCQFVFETNLKFNEKYHSILNLKKYFFESLLQTMGVKSAVGFSRQLAKLNLKML